MLLLSKNLLHWEYYDHYEWWKTWDGSYFWIVRGSRVLSLVAIPWAYPRLGHRAKHPRPPHSPKIQQYKGYTKNIPYINNIKVTKWNENVPSIQKLVTLRILRSLWMVKNMRWFLFLYCEGAAGAQPCGQDVGVPTAWPQGWAPAAPSQSKNTTI